MLFLFTWQNKSIHDLDKGMVTSMTLIDLKKVFNRIDHDVLLEKLDATGSFRHTVNWFKSYLPIRSFLNKQKITFFQPVSVSCSVHQGSILGPLLFLIYVNDMPQAV